MTKKIKIGLFGFGCVGKGLYDVLQQTPGIKAELVKIVVKDRNKKRVLPDSYFSFDRDDILNNPEIDVIVELIDDPEAAFYIVSTALKKGKAVITANKKMIAEHFDELYALQIKHNVPLLYEAACCASIPVIRNLEEYYDNDLLSSIEGIVNGSTNYILTKIFQEGLTYDKALVQAQDLGFAESDPRLDVEGFDAKYKLSLLLTHSFGICVNPAELFAIGINRISAADAKYANEKGLKIKLIAQAKKSLNGGIATFVAPAFISKENAFYNVDNEYNAVKIQSSFADKQVFIGKGAGAFPTASAVLSDISALTYNYKYEYKKIRQQAGLVLTNDFECKVYVGFQGDICKDKFINISEQYASKAHNYLVGSIKFSDLVNTEWINNPANSVIFMN